MADPIPTRTKEEDAASARVGSTVRGKWRLDALLGVGGVAAVYAATHRNGQRAALKLMHPELARDRGIVDRFLREAYVANKVGHPACVKVLDDDVTETDEPFLVMELLEGETVRDFWRRTGRTIPASQALHIAERVLDCLSACHAVGVVHRDLKPANIFLTRSGAIKLLDFGVAREEGARHEGDKTVGLALGTPAYMSPEQAKGQVDRIDGRSDLFSVGALLHALITGRRIHRGKTEKESLHLAAHEPVPSVATVDPAMPGELVRLIDKALAWEPERRFASAREMQSAVLMAMRVASDARRSTPDDGEVEDPPDLTPVHEVVARDDARVREVEAMLGAWDRALADGLVHGFASSSAEPALHRAFDSCVEIHRKRSAPIALVVRPFGLAAFDHVVWEPVRPLAAVPHRLFEAGVRVLRIMPGLAFAELRTLLACVGAPGDVDVGATLWEAALPHVRIDACVVSCLGDIAAREAFAAESLRDETQASHRIHAARDAGAAWSEEASPLAPDDVIRAVYASQLGLDRWDERYAELYTDALLQGARTRNVGAVLGAIRRVAAELYGARRYEDAATLREALVERLARRVGPKDAPKLAAAVTGAMLGKDALDTLLRSATRFPEDVPRMRALLDEVPATEAPTVVAAAARPMPIEARDAVAALVGRISGPAEAEAIGERAGHGPASGDPGGVPTVRKDLSPDAILERDARAERDARIVVALAAVLEESTGHEEALATLAQELGEEARERPFEMFFADAVTFASGRMLYAERAVHEAAQRVASLLARCGAHALVCQAPPTEEQLRAFAAQTRAVLDRAAPLPSQGPLALVALSQAARTRGVALERLAIEPRVMRVHASTVAVLRCVGGGASDVPRAVAHAARSIVDVASAPPWLLAAVTEPDLDADEASLAASAAMLATAMARLLVEDRSQLLRVALAALTVPSSASGGPPEEFLPRAALALASQTSGERTALARSVVAYESAWLARSDRDGAVYRGARAPTLHARIVACARDWLARLADRSPPPPTPESVVASLAQRAADTAERTVLRLLVATLGFIPAGTVVRLSSGETAEVIASNRGTARGPLARLVLDESGEEYSESFEVELAMSGDDGLRIEKVLGIEQWRKGETAAAPKPPPAPRRAAPPPPGPPPREEPPPVPREDPPGDRGSVSVSGARPASASPRPATSEVKPTASGTLATTPLVNTLVYMLDHGLTGTIELREPSGARHEIHFSRGAPVRLRAGMPLDALVNLDPATTFAFYRDVDAIGDAGEKLEIEPLGAIFGAARAWKDRSRVRRLVERASGLLLAIHPESALDAVDLTEEERVLLGELREQPSHFIELVTRSSVSAETIDTFLFVALVTRQLLVPGQAKAPMGVRPPSMRVRDPSPFPTGSTAPLPPTTSMSPPASTRAPAHKKISWSDLLAVRRPPSHGAIPAQRTPPVAHPAAPPSSPASAQPKAEAAPATGAPAKPTGPARAHPAPTGQAADAVATIKRAEQALAQKDVQGALRLAERAREQDASVAHVQAFHAWVRVLAGELRPAQAIAAVDKALAFDESCVPARLLRAKLLKREDRMPEAMHELELVLASDPENKDAQNELKLLLLTVKPSR